MSLLRMWLQNRNSKNVAGLHFILKVISQKILEFFFLLLETVNSCQRYRQAQHREGKGEKDQGSRER